MMLVLLTAQFRKSLLLHKTVLARLNAIFLAMVIVLFFSFMARIDFIVNSKLYNYGLIFSYDWANLYWTTYYTTFVIFSLITSLIYWSGSQKTTFDMKITAILFGTINLLAAVGLQDVLYFVFWAGGLPSNNVVWWWSQWTIVFGTWNSLMQVAFTVITIGISILMWTLVLFQKKKADGYSLKYSNKINLNQFQNQLSIALDNTPAKYY